MFIADHEYRRRTAPTALFPLALLILTVVVVIKSPANLEWFAVCQVSLIMEFIGLMIIAIIIFTFHN